VTELHPDLRENVRMLGELLGQSIQRHPGQDCYELIEEVRAAAKADRRQESGSGQRLVNLLGKLRDDELLPVTRSWQRPILRTTATSPTAFSSPPLITSSQCMVTA